LKVLVAGEYAWPWYQQACAGALEELGCNVVRFGWLERFKKWQPGAREPVYRSFMHRLQYRLLAGPLVSALNRDLIDTAERERPDAIWLYNAQYIYARTLRQLRARVPHAVLCQYANDNPFSPSADRVMWRHFVAGIPLFHLHHAYRHDNIDAFRARGAREVRLLRAYFIPETDYPLERASIDARYHADVVFAGHYEDDGRVDALEAICGAGYKLSLYGGGWNAALSTLSPDSPLRALYPIQPATGDEYNRALCGAKVALCFLSALNTDTYTRRSFQIPAMRVAMLSQWTDDLATLFNEDEQAVFFRDTDELLRKLRHLLDHDDVREHIAAAGFRRVYRDGHDVRSRMREWLHAVEEYRQGVARQQRNMAAA
jgi:spore maturation protein CgeB